MLTASPSRRSRSPTPNCGILVSTFDVIRPNPVGLTRLDFICQYFSDSSVCSSRFNKVIRSAGTTKYLWLERAAGLGKDALQQERTAIPRDLGNHTTPQVGSGNRHHQLFVRLLIGESHESNADESECSRQHRRTLL